MSLREKVTEYMEKNGVVSFEDINDLFGCGNRTYRYAKSALRGKEFTLPEAPPDDLSVPELLKRKSESYKVYKTRHDFNKLIPIKINIDGPIGICHFGDPHLDDDGCDIDQLISDVETVRNTPGMFAGNVGDTNNNWVGRLAALHENQSTTAKQAWKLVNWFMKELPWLYIVSGNHGLWSGSRDPIYWMLGEVANYGPASVRMNLQFPNKRDVRVNVRHDFRGYSQWNQVHGSMKAAQMGWRDHVLTCGHKHISGQGFVVDPSTGLISHCLQVATYKVIDDYAENLCLPNQNVSPCCVTIIDPDAKHERDLVQIFWSLERAADYLNFLRNR